MVALDQESLESSCVDELQVAVVHLVVQMVHIEVVLNSQVLFVELEQVRQLDLVENQLAQQALHTFIQALV